MIKLPEKAYNITDILTYISLFTYIAQLQI